MSVIDFVFLILGTTLILAFIRLIIGPTLPDRIAALDLIMVTAVGSIAVYSIASHEPAFLDVAVTVAVITFIGTIAVARFLEQRAKDERIDR